MFDSTDVPVEQVFSPRFTPPASYKNARQCFEQFSFTFHYADSPAMSQDKRRTRYFELTLLPTSVYHPLVFGRELEVVKLRVRIFRRGSMSRISKKLDQNAEALADVEGLLMVRNRVAVFHLGPLQLENTNRWKYVLLVTSSDEELKGGDTLCRGTFAISSEKVNFLKEAVQNGETRLFSFLAPGEQKKAT